MIEIKIILNYILECGLDMHNRNWCKKLSRRKTAPVVSEQPARAEKYESDRVKVDRKLRKILLTFFIGLKCVFIAKCFSA